MKKAFSIIELLISLIIISVIVSAFAPVITKKMKHGKISISQNSKKISSNCTSIHENCKLCYEGELNCLLCLAACGSGEFVDNIDCACKNCSTKFPSCALCTQTKCTKCLSGYGLNSGTCTQCAAGTASDGSGACSSCSGEKQYSAAGAAFCSTCPTGQKANSNHTGCENITCADDEYLSGDTCIKCSSVYPNCKACSNGACTACEDNYRLISGACKKYGTPTSQADCSKYNAIYVPSYKAGVKASCVTKYNAGDKTGPNIDGIGLGLFATKLDYDGSCTSSLGCCYRGQSGASDNCTTSGNIASKARVEGYAKYDYDGCNRTVCTDNSAKLICSKHAAADTYAGDWRLPTKEDFENWMHIINTLDATKKSATVSYLTKFKGADGLQLCDYTSGDYGLARCKGRGTVSDAKNSFYCMSSCNPEKMIASNGSSITSAHIEKGQMLWGATGGNWSYAGSVRCVIDDIPK